MNKTKFAIGCFVQWYEIEVVKEYISSLKKSLNNYDGDVIVDFVLNVNQKLEKLNEDLISIDDIKSGFINEISKISNVKFKINEDFISISDYRRIFMDKYCEQVDVLINGESDCLIPHNTFKVLDTLHSEVKDVTPKYISTFAINKMWDNSWKQLEHVDFTDKPFINDDELNWWSIRYNMKQSEMDTFNKKVKDLDLLNINPHKFNGCGLIVSSEVIKCGINIPRGVFFINEDTAFQTLTRKMLPDMPQYHFKNILIVHNRKHPKKRMYVKNEENIEYIDDKRKSNDWYTISNQMCTINEQNLFNPKHKFYTWEDVWKKTK